MSIFAAGLRETSLSRLNLTVVAALLVAAAAGAAAAYAPAHPQLLKAGVLAVAAVGLLFLALRLQPPVVPVAVIVGLLALGNLHLSRVLSVPVIGYQEKIVLAIFVGLAAVGAALDATTPRRPPWPAALWLGLLFLAVGIGSLFYAADRELARPPVVHVLVEMGALVAGFYWVRRVRDAHALVVCLAVAGVISAALGVWQFLVPEAFNGLFGPFVDRDLRPLMDIWAIDVGRVGALWVHAPPFAAFLSALLPAFLYLWFQQRRRPWNLLAAAGFIMTMVALVLTGSRIEFVGAIISIVVFLVVWGSGRNQSSRVRAGALPALVGAVLVASLISAGGSGENNALGRLMEFVQGHPETSASVSNRLAIYGNLGETWRANPIVGVGLGNTRSGIEELTTYNTTPHSYWLGLMAETGFVGTGLMVLMLAAMLAHYRRLLRRAVGSRERGFAVFALAASVALLLGGIADNAMLRVWQVGVVFWLVQGAVLSLSLRSGDDTGAHAEAIEPVGTEETNVR